LEVLLPILYLKGVSTGDFGEALAALLGKDAPGLSASNIARLKDIWADEHKAWEETRPLDQALRVCMGWSPRTTAVRAVRYAPASQRGSARASNRLPPGERGGVGVVRP